MGTRIGIQIERRVKSRRREDELPTQFGRYRRWIRPRARFVRDDRIDRHGRTGKSENWRIARLVFTARAHSGRVAEMWSRADFVLAIDLFGLKICFTFLGGM